VLFDVFLSQQQCTGKVLGDERIDALRERSKNTRQDTWNTIKELSPETANWMLQMNQVFGQHSYINLKINGKVLIDKGSQDGVRDMTVPKSRGRW
jgi:hypothetical protein